MGGVGKQPVGGVGRQPGKPAQWREAGCTMRGSSCEGSGQRGSRLASRLRGDAQFAPGPRAYMVSASLRAIDQPPWSLHILPTQLQMQLWYRGSAWVPRRCAVVAQLVAPKRSRHLPGGQQCTLRQTPAAVR